MAPLQQYINRNEAMEELGLSTTAMRTILNEIRSYSGVGKRYGPYALRGSGRLMQVRYAVLTDYMSYRDRLRNKDARKYVPDFDVREAERDLGVTSDVFVTQQITADPELIAGAIVRQIASKISAG